MADAISPPSAKQPAARFGTDEVSVSIFKDERTTKKGQAFTATNVVVSRSYKDGDSWARTHSLRPKDVAIAIAALQEAQEWLASKSS